MHDTLDLLERLLEFLELVHFLRVLVLLDELLKLGEREILVGCMTWLRTCRSYYLFGLKGFGELLVHLLDDLQSDTLGILVVGKHCGSDLVLVNVDVAFCLGVRQI